MQVDNKLVLLPPDRQWVWMALTLKNQQLLGDKVCPAGLTWKGCYSDCRYRSKTNNRIVAATVVNIYFWKEFKVIILIFIQQHTIGVISSGFYKPTVPFHCRQPPGFRVHLPVSVPARFCLLHALSACSSHAPLSAADISSIQPDCSIDEGSATELNKSPSQRSNFWAHRHVYNTLHWWSTCSFTLTLTRQCHRQRQRQFK